MKIVHICLAGSYNDNWNYQDNIIPKYHKIAGHDVTVITSIFINSKNNVGYEKVSPGEYFLENGVKIIRIPFIKFILNNVVEKLRLYQGTYEKLELEKPDFIFIHGLQFLDIYQVVKYLRKNRRVKVVVDNHADFSNSARNFLSRNILHKVIWRYCAQLIEPYTTRFYGVLPARVDFLKTVYKLPEEKVELLVMGADDEKVKEARNENVKKEIREKYNIKPDDFLIITGGKIDNAKKQTLLLMEAVKKIKSDKVKLIVFGSVIEDLKDEVNILADGEKVQYIGWIPADKTYNYFAAADLAVFPGRHSVFWEQVVGLGIPMIVKYWEGTTHVDVGGNCIFLYKDSEEEIREKILYLIDNPEVYKKMKDVAEKNGIKKFSYSSIANQSINVN
ncbi:glycosyl transferase group 1 [Thermoanaerobacterium xylanolyticum LX-11]|uniref:Glycosyl transferase group 1 n=1 Tax=Thermoanaerobacterium xylanolyticum (strain ATCC 49914 / DSM 7097 / LX-11) TaxID=858215 RepID=F6BIT6_THEXL|nr:glycosyltransferase family 4 protein [Thermoanaerobacterium xylanolyticum]AEF17821.1 glycosyl transferase group 1 [Thermoanaerobacterium xylanolyticum LX-11]